MAVGLSPPKQVRSRRTLDRILDAAAEIARAEGVERLTVARVVRRARSSVGSFYARFGGRDDLVRFLRERAGDEARRRWSESVEECRREGTSLESVVRRLVRGRIRGEEEEIGRWTALSEDPKRSDGGERSRFEEEMMEDFCQLLLERRQEITHGDPVRAAKVGYLMVIGAIREQAVMLGQPFEATGPGDGGGLEKELSQALLAYLASGPADVEGGPVDWSTSANLFDVWT